MPGTQPKSAGRSRIHYQQQPIQKLLALTVQQAAQTFHQSANQEQKIADDFQFQPQAAFYRANDTQMKQLSASSAPVNAVDLRAHL